MSFEAAALEEDAAKVWLGAAMVPEWSVGLTGLWQRVAAGTAIHVLLSSSAGAVVRLRCSPGTRLSADAPVISHDLP